MSKLTRVLILIAVWLIVTSLYAYYYVVSILARREEFDAYAMNWQFQLMMFSLFRLPYMLLALAVLIGIVVVLPQASSQRSLRPSASSALNVNENAENAESRRER